MNDSFFVSRSIDLLGFRIQMREIYKPLNLDNKRSHLCIFFPILFIVNIVKKRRHAFNIWRDVSYFLDTMGDNLGMSPAHWKISV